MNNTVILYKTYKNTTTFDLIVALVYHGYHQRGSRLKKLLTTIILVCLLPLLVFADSFTFGTTIDGVSGGPNGFGFGMFPLGTSYSHAKSFSLLGNNFPAATFNVSTSFSFSLNYIPTEYSYKEGIPYWSLTPYERANEYSSLFWNGSSTYFNPRGNLYLYLQQGFGTNPVEKSGPLVYLRLAWNTLYSMALDANPIVPGLDLVFVDENGAPNGPFGPGTNLPGMPWLQDNRIALNNNLALSTYWYLYKNTGTDAYDGAYAELTLEYGPSWLANTITPKGTISNYWKAYAYLEEKLTLCSTKQENGMNWATLYIGHSNSYSYVGGDVVPENKIPGDRLRHSFSDAIWIHLAGPQFIAGDCYTYIDLGIYNNIYFGNVVNEVSQKTQAIELQSSLRGLFHLRLFGFIRFDYSFGYVFNRGLYASGPGWWQSAEVSFYVTI